MAYRKKYNSKKYYSGNQKRYFKPRKKNKPNFSKEMKRYAFMHGVFQKGLANENSAIYSSYNSGLDYPGKKKYEKKPLV